MITYNGLTFQKLPREDVNGACLEDVKRYIDVSVVPVAVQQTVRPARHAKAVQDLDAWWRGALWRHRGHMKYAAN